MHQHAPNILVSLVGLGSSNGSLSSVTVYTTVGVLAGQSVFVAVTTCSTAGTAFSVSVPGYASASPYYIVSPTGGGVQQQGFWIPLASGLAAGSAITVTGTFTTNTTTAVFKVVGAGAIQNFLSTVFTVTSGGRNTIALSETNQSPASRISLSTNRTGNRHSQATLWVALINVTNASASSVGTGETILVNSTDPIFQNSTVAWWTPFPAYQSGSTESTTATFNASGNAVIVGIRFIPW